MFYTYILQLNNGSSYCGYSDNLKQRYRSHQNGEVESTKNLRPVKLVFYAAFFSKNRALKFEQYLKSSSGIAFKKKHLI